MSLNNDLISRSALVDEFRARKMTDAVPNYDRTTVDVKDALYQYAQLTKGLLFAAPAVDAEVVRHGKWEAVKNTGLEEWCAPPIRCSNCGKTMPDVGADFCPFCGQMNAEVEGC